MFLSGTDTWSDVRGHSREPRGWVGTPHIQCHFSYFWSPSRGGCSAFESRSSVHDALVHLLHAGKAAWTPICLSQAAAQVIIWPQCIFLQEKMIQSCALPVALLWSLRHILCTLLQPLHLHCTPSPACSLQQELQIWAFCHVLLFLRVYWKHLDVRQLGKWIINSLSATIIGIK